MPSRDRRPVRDVAPAFSGGLNVSADPSAVQANELRRAENVRLTEYGGATRRNGTKRLHATALGSGNPVRGGFAWKKAASTELLAVSNGTLFTGTYNIGMSWDTETGALSTSAPISFAQFYSSGDVVYLADGGALNKWDGATLTTDIANSQAVSTIAVYNERLFGITGTNETLFWSSIANGDTLGYGAGGGGSANIRTFGNQRLTGLLALGGSLLLFHVDGISRFTGVGLDDISISAGTQGVSQDTGTIAPRSIVAVENTGFFAASRGIFMVTEGGVADISTTITPVFEELAASEVAGITAAHNEQNRELWFFIPSKGVYVYQYRLKAWSGPWTGHYTDPTHATTSLWDALDSNGVPIVLRGTKAGYVERCDMPGVFVDGVTSAGTGGTAYTMAVQPRRFFAGDPATEKSLRDGYLLADFRGSTTVTVSWEMGKDAGTSVIQGPPSQLWDGGLTWDSGLLWSGSTVDSYHFPMWGRGRYVDVTIADDGRSNALLSRLEITGFDMTRR